MVADNFQPRFMHRVMLYGEIYIGAFEKSVEVSKGFVKHSGINDATLRNVTVGDNCLIEKIGNYINNYTIGSDCHICNVSTIETTAGATFGEGNTISVLNEVGEGNVVIFNGLGAQLAAFMVRHNADSVIKGKLMELVGKHVKATAPDRGTLGKGIRIINSKEITNCVIGDGCEIDGAVRLYDCTIQSSQDSTVRIGAGVICEHSVISDGSCITNSVKMQNCFVGECCRIENGFTASASIFFANSYMSNGEACAAFCGPFSASHHKSTLLIGGMYSFYNAGSGTNFSNHAYKMGPMHWGTLERGTKTASGTHIMMPARIGTFSVCFGKLLHHPDTKSLPFSYLFDNGGTMYLVPGRNITTVGLYRDIRKWPARDLRPAASQRSIINFDWLSPFSVGEIIEGKRILEKLREASGDNVTSYNYHEYVISTSSLVKGIKNYDMALRIYLGAVLKRRQKIDPTLAAPVSATGTGEWVDFAGLLLPESEELRMAEDIKDGTLDSIGAINVRFRETNDNYREYQWAWTYRIILDYYGLERITPEDAVAIHNDYIQARRAWIAEIRLDAEKEYAMGDVEKAVLEDLCAKLDKETDFEN